ETGELIKAEYGPWVFAAFRLLARLRFLRGSALDPFGYSRERKVERQLVRDYEAVIEEILGKLDAGNHALAVRIAGIPEEIRGFGHIKERNLKKAKAKEAELLAALRAPAKMRTAA
ncbi:MAG TPA: DUF6537 domain-containing protein, partial [Burkholderiales bacterium]|nr:DUF6537 domain-containing protein [Burkholderiales bacterium]